MPDLKGLDIHTHVPPRGGRKADPRADQKERYFRRLLKRGPDGKPLPR